MPNLARDRRLNADERIRRPGTRPIAAESQHHAVLEEGLPLIARGWLFGVGVRARLARTESRRSDIDHRQRSVAREIGVADRRGVFYSQPPVPRSVAPLRLLIGIEDHVDGVESRGMRHQLIAAP